MSRIFVISMCALMAVFCAGSPSFAQHFEDQFDTLDTSVWTQVDRGECSVKNGVLSMKDCYVYAGDVSWKNYALEFKARAPKDADTVRIFASFRFISDQNRYVFGMRGGNNNDLFLARYGDRNKNALLKIESLDFIPEKGVWYTIRIEIKERGIQVFLNNEKKARLTASDAGAPYESGKIALGGGWSKVQFDCVNVSPLEGYKIHKDAVRYNFQSLKDTPVTGWTPIDNSRYTKEKGIGWNEGGLFTRKRNQSDDPLFDSLVGFSDLGSKILLVDLPDGDYVVSIHMGDPKYRSKNRIFFMDELQPSINNISGEGQSNLLRKSITTYGGTLRMRFELDEPGVGGSFNWMAVETREQAGEDAWEKYLTTVKKDNAEEKEALRKQQRAAYRPVKIGTIQDGRSVFSLNGDWLFVPDYEVGKTRPWDVAVDDSTWHVLDVPSFWTLNLSWNYIEGEGRGSKNLWEKENARCEAYTFDYKKAKTGYYRHTLILPDDLAGKTIQINFDAIGRESKVWVNGTSVAEHTGMFAPVRADITKQVHPGKNVVVVRAGDSLKNPEYNTRDIGRAPIHMLFGRDRGIWQNVSLEISDQLTIDDTFFKPQLNHFDLEATVVNRSDQPISYQLAAQIRDHADNKLVYDHVASSRTGLTAAPGQTLFTKLASDDKMHAPFKNWSPAFPNLYKADIFAYNYNTDDSVDLKSFSDDAIKLNFQSVKDPTVDGWIPVDGRARKWGSKKGWSEKIETVDRNLIEDQLSDTFVMPNPDSEAVFTYKLPDGDYVITLQFGDPAAPTLAEAYVGRGVNQIDQAIVRDFKKKGETVTVLQSLSVTNGKLEITVPRMPEVAAGTALDWLVIEKRAEVSNAKWKLGLNHFNVLDNVAYNVGFRTFKVDGDNLVLNGKPFKLLGATLTPNLVRPNDKPLAEWFMKTVHDNNLNVVKNHACPFNDIWLTAADEAGVGTSTEGIWVWLMLKGKGIPNQAMLDIWQDEWGTLLNKQKNHPSLLWLTHNSEMKLWIANEKERFEIHSDAVKKFRKIDPTRPVVCSTGYCRGYMKDKGGKLPGIDDGDIDDSHTFHNWYDRVNFFWLRDEVSYHHGVRTPGRPYTSNEFAAGYPDADTGHPIKHYIYQHMVPQALIGKWCYEDRDPKYWLKRHALVNKESQESIRVAYRDTSCGMMLFALGTWFQNLYDLETIKPYPVLEAVSKATAPVMVSAQLGGRHFYAGSSHTVDAVVVNDSPLYETLNDIFVDWEVNWNGKVLSSGTKIYSGSLEYYKNKREELTFTMPEKLPKPRVNAKLVLKLHANDRAISTNTYDIVVANQNFVNDAAGLRVGVYEKGNHLSDVLSDLGTEVVLADLTNLDAGDFDVLVVGRLNSKPAGYENIVQFAEAGGKVLLSNNKEFAVDLLPKEITGLTTESKEIVTPCAYESPVFDGIEPDDMCWFTGTRDSKESLRPGIVPIACESAYNVNDFPYVIRQAETTRIHGYYRKESDKYDPGSTLSYDDVHGYPLVEIRKGKGCIIVSSMILGADQDPIAGKLLANILGCLSAD